MIPGIEPRELPRWLAEFQPEHGAERVPIRSLLEHSLYYAACGRDGDPVRYLGGFVHSYVFVDYTTGRDAVLASLRDSHHGFHGYRILHWRDVGVDELMPQGVPPPRTGEKLPAHLLRFEDCIKPPFALWVVFEREPAFGAEHGPERLSLLYIGGEGVATFQALYHGHRCAPDVVAIIRPGTSFGFNWTDFCDPSREFARCVLNNPTGAPRHLLVGEMWGHTSDRPCWPNYGRLIHRWRAADVQLALWERT